MPVSSWEEVEVGRLTVKPVTFLLNAGQLEPAPNESIHKISDARILVSTVVGEVKVFKLSKVYTI